ncbi:hypothetical protein WJX73_003692 [Symbiochloris irregularis]|uniref:Ubiquinone biosynthesis protein n=1 Tax=Symbiochloris irregularis TaxID=706552 RepID=A0AAW1PEH4_9CHLO
MRRYCKTLVESTAIPLPRIKAGDRGKRLPPSVSCEELLTEWEEDEEQTRAREVLLDAALKHVMEKGWSLDAVRAGARDLDLSPAIAASLKRGAGDLVEHFVQQCNDQFSVQIEERRGEFENLRLRERIALLVRWRLELTAPFIDSWPQAMAVQALPANMGPATRQLALLVDDMWHAAGDTATEYNWYTKRALLAGVYTASELYMLTDYSPGLADTWEALDRRVRDVMRLGRMAGQVSQAASQSADGLRAFASWLYTRTASSQPPQYQ